jgi:hypothetical protein
MVPKPTSGGKIGARTLQKTVSGEGPKQKHERYKTSAQKEESEEEIFLKLYRLST